MSSSIHQNLTQNQYLVTYAVLPHENGIRLDHFLKGHYRKRSRERLKQAIRLGVVQIERKKSPHSLCMGGNYTPVDVLSSPHAFSGDQRTEIPAFAGMTSAFYGTFD